MKDIYPEFADDFAFYAVASDPSEKLDKLEAYREREGHPWLVAEPTGTMLRDLNVLVQSTKIAIDSQGVIIYRDGYGQGGEETWRQVFQELAASAAGG
jgi:hypothetical protein